MPYLNGGYKHNYQEVLNYKDFYDTTTLHTITRDKLHLLTKFIITFDGMPHVVRSLDMLVHDSSLI